MNKRIAFGCAMIICLAFTFSAASYAGQDYPSPELTDLILLNKSDEKRMQDPKDAVAFYSGILKANPLHTDAAFNLASAYYCDHDYKHAIEYYDYLLSRCDASTRAQVLSLYNRGLALYNAGFYKDARHFCPAKNRWYPWIPA